jgi:hypothetical protein
MDRNDLVVPIGMERSFPFFLSSSVQSEPLTSECHLYSEAEIYDDDSSTENNEEGELVARNEKIGQVKNDEVNEAIPAAKFEKNPAFKLQSTDFSSEKKSSLLARKSTLWKRFTQRVQGVSICNKQKSISSRLQQIYLSCTPK